MRLLMTNHYDVLVLGGGVVGLTAALALAQRHYRVAIIDAKTLLISNEQSNGRVYALNHASQDLLTQVGVWPLIASQQLSPYQSMHIWDAKSNAHIDFNVRDIGKPQLGYMLEEAILKNGLMQRINRELNITCFPNQAIDAIQSSNTGLILQAKMQSWQAPLTFITDGAASIGRKLLEIPTISWPYHQAAIVASVFTEKPHHCTAYQVFTAQGSLAFLPLPHPHHCSIVWSTSTAHANTLAQLSSEAFDRILSVTFSQKLGDTKLSSARTTFPLMMRHAQSYVGKNWILAGDAAHTIHPLAGLGLNMGLADVRCWLECSEKGMHARALGAYQRQRKNAVWQTIALMEGLKWLFLNPLPGIAPLRGLGLRLCNQILPLKQQFMRYADPPVT